MFFNQIFVFLSLALASTAAQTPTHVGDLFHFTPSLGACGYVNTTSQIVASVANTTFNTFPGATKNPNENPICHHKLFIKHGPDNITASIVDFYEAKTDRNVGLSPAGFMKFGNLSDGIIHNVTWSIV